jgi:methionyl-tRNA synthetase
MSFYVTTPIYYPNGVPHLGHAYTTLVADFLARYKRLLGEETMFVTGTDENSQKIVKTAIWKGQDPHEFLQENVGQFKELFTALEISYDDFIRTTEQRHIDGALRLWKKMEEAGDLYKKTYKGLYCVGSESFVTEKDLRPGNLCPDHDEEPVEVEEENWFFALSKYKDFLIEAISTDRLRVLPESRKNEVLSFLQGEELQDISFSRVIREGDETWGIRLPSDPAQVMYVWCDALSNYLNAIGYGASEPEAALKFAQFWPANLHVVGKDILRFHAVYWPAMLQSAGLPLPKNILVHGLITSQGRKMSKSIGNVIDPLTLVQEYGGEAVRFFIAKELSVYTDPEMTLEGFRNAYNAFLANGIGNLTNRIMKMAISYEVEYGDLSERTLSETDGFKRYSEGFNNFDVSFAMEVVWDKVSGMDKYIQDTEPFKMIKVAPDEAKDIVATLVRGLYDVALMLEPIIPTTSHIIRDCVLKKEMPKDALFPRKE